MKLNTNKLAQLYIKSNNIKHISSFLDKDNILWRYIDDVWVGRRSVWTKDFRAVWLDEVSLQDIKSYWCGDTADYNEQFKI